MRTSDPNQQTLSIGFSPCPNDTFIFDALIHNKIDTEGISFNVVMEDVEALNNRAFESELDISKLSFATFARVTENYVLLDAGAALGNGVGPLLISQNKVGPENINEQTLIAIPGRFTTANFLLCMAFPVALNKKEMLFNEIETAVLKGSAEAGLIIHENRFTYQAKGLHKIIDLGEFWEHQTHLPIPLGGIVVRRNLPLTIQKKINRLIRKSVEYAFSNPDSCKTFVKENAQEMEEEVIQKHINLYVNNYALNLGETGRKAVQVFFDKALELGIIPQCQKNIFIETN
jgi:1,4-dihydroxy-6-naphthoate synthase